MNDTNSANELQRKLEELRSDFAAVCGRPFQYFYCPLLLADDAVRLCRAHLVNEAFRNTSRRCTVQRADVDSFYGTFFEADFVLLGADDATVATSVAQGSTGRLRPKILRQGQEVQYYHPTPIIPPHHSKVLLEVPSGAVAIALKISPEAIRETCDEDWQISIEKDCRLAALVSLLKAAHLTLFEMLGYRYALSAGGTFLGRTVLGKFYLENQGLGRAEVLRNAKTHFAEFKNLVRPVVLALNTSIEDTVSDRIVYICEGSCRWAFLVFIRTAGLAHAVIVPLMETPEAANRFVCFLKESGSRFQARRCHYDSGIFKASLDSKTMDWPAANLE